MKDTKDARNIAAVKCVAFKLVQVLLLLFNIYTCQLNVLISKA